MSDARLNLQDLSVDSEARVAVYAGEPLQLGDRTFDALCVLAVAAPGIVSKSELAAAVWPGKEVSDETVAQRISLLRKAFKSVGQSAPEVRNIHGRGYQLIVPAHSTEAAPPAVPAKPAPKSQLNWMVAASFAGVGVLALGLVAASSAKRDAVKVLVDQETGAVWVGNSKDPVEPYPVVANVDGRSVLINSPANLEDVQHSPAALSVYCALARDFSLFEMGVPPDLQQSLAKAKTLEPCLISGDDPTQDLDVQPN
ncbi:MAG: winged helix-turn-helix domain-containing protein [Parvularculaceae bacterium]|nr:winged helix-turn-helix domain-containing protein [Parvularculaceae bacterium]